MKRVLKRTAELYLFREYEIKKMKLKTSCKFRKLNLLERISHFNPIRYPGDMIKDVERLRSSASYWNDNLTFSDMYLHWRTLNDLKYCLHDHRSLHCNSYHFKMLRSRIIKHVAIAICSKDSTF